LGQKNDKKNSKKKKLDPDWIENLGQKDISLSDG
jgi:hypothetical protein